MEGKHEKQISSQVFKLRLALLKNASNTETWIRAWIIWQLSIVLKSLLKGFRALGYQIRTHLSNSLNHAE